MIPHSRPWLGPEEREAVVAALSSGWVGGGGEQSQRFGRELAASLGREAAIGVGSGTAAIELALRVVGVQGRRVAVPAFACLSVERAIARAGGVPYLVDADPGDLSFPLGALAEIAEHCVAAVLVHQFGIPAAAATETGWPTVPVVEDITTVVGGRVGGRPTGLFGRFGVLSLAATKMFTAGEGGAVMGSPADVAGVAQWTDPESALPAHLPVPNAKLAEMASAMARVQLRRLPEFVRRRAAIAAHYDVVTGGLGLQVKRARPVDTGTWWRYLVELPAGMDAQTAVDRALALGVTFARPVQRHWPAGRFPVAERLRSALVSIPLYPAMTDGEVERVGEVLNLVLAGRRREVRGTDGRSR